MILRKATESDLPSILRIYNEVIAYTTATFEEHLRPLEELQTTYQEKMQHGRYPMIVVEINQQVVGYGTFGLFRKASGYQTTVEHSLHILPGFRGQGLGKKILQELIVHAQKQKFHAMIAAIDSSNAASISLHQKLGFKIVGEIPQVAQKFSRWLNLTLMQLILGT